MACLRILILVLVALVGTPSGFTADQPRLPWLKKKRTLEVYPAREPASVRKGKRVIAKPKITRKHYPTRKATRKPTRRAPIITRTIRRAPPPVYAPPPTVKPAPPPAYASSPQTRNHAPIPLQSKGKRDKRTIYLDMTRPHVH